MFLKAPVELPSRDLFWTFVNFSIMLVLQFALVVWKHSLALVPMVCSQLFSAIKFDSVSSFPTLPH